MKVWIKCWKLSKIHNISPFLGASLAIRLPIYICRSISILVYENRFIFVFASKSNPNSQNKKLNLITFYYFKVKYNGLLAEEAQFYLDMIHNNIFLYSEHPVGWRQCSPHDTILHSSHKHCNNYWKCKNHNLFIQNIEMHFFLN